MRISMLFLGLLAGVSAMAGTSEEGFRELFLESVMRGNSPTAEASFPKLMYRVPSQLAPSRYDSLEVVDRDLRALSSVALYQESVKTPPKLSGKLEQALKDRASLIVIVPGVFGEFIETRAFDPIFKSEESSLAKAWKEALLRAGNVPTDSSYSLQNLESRELPLGELVKMASLDDESGNAAVRAMIFHTPILSLESVSRIEEVAAIFSRRLDKALSLLGSQVPESITFVGYSRGTMVGLEMLAQAKATKAAWVSKVKRFVSLGGVVHGTVLADEAHRPETISGKQREMVAAQAERLLEASDFTSFVKNTHAWNKLALDMARLDPSMLKLLKGDSKIWSVDASNGIRGLLRIWQELGIQKEALAILKGGADSVRNLPRLFTQLGAAGRANYVRDIRKWKKSVREVLNAVGEMTTSARDAWWKSHQVPAEISYYSLVATMTNPEEDAALASNPFGYAVGSFDDDFLLQSFRQFQNASGQPAARLNDSQVAISHAVFHPAVIEKANGQKLDTQVLGVLGTHHWGLALEVVTPMADGSKNPFPRLSLLRAIAALE